MKKKDLIRKWLDNDQLTSLESEAFKNLDAYDSYIKIAQTAKNFKAPNYDLDSNLKELTSKISDRKTEHNSLFNRNMMMRVAAILVLGFGIYFSFFYSSQTVIKTLAGQKTLIDLPDGSTVNINALSSIQYQKEEWQNNRLIVLEGEAYFDVAKGKRFDVKTDTGIISVLGTEFNIKQRENYFEVVCYEGLVSVLYKGNTTKLPAGNVFKVVQNRTLNETTSLLKPKWIENNSTFTSVPYKYILKEFERQYNVTITAKNIDLNKLFTGNFVHSNIQTAIQSITIPMRLDYTINDNNITLYYKE